MKSKIRLILRENLDADREHRDSLNKTGFWGKAGAGAIIIAKSTGRLLIPKRSPYVEQPNTWGVWGGAIDPNEDPKEAARREIAEECGYAGNIKLLPLYVFHAATSDFKYFNFLGIVDEEFTPKLDWETSEAEWFDLRKLPTPLHFGLIAVLRDTDSLNNIQKIANAPRLSEQAKIKMVLRENVDKPITCKKCGWHWKQSESSDKEMYKCHKCGHDNEPKLKEHLQLADKVYFQTGKLSPEAKQIILNITNGDAYTKIITDMYFAFLSDDEKASRIDILSRNELRELENAHRQLTTYNKNVFPIEGFDILNNTNPYNLLASLKIRESIILELKNLPTVAVKNLRADIRQPRNVSELNQYKHTLDYFMGSFSVLSNRAPKFQQEILNKMFKEGSTLDAWSDFVEQKENMLGGVQFTRNMVKKIVKEAYDSDLDIVYDKGNVMIIEVTGPKGITAIGCNSLWCFTYGGGNNWNQWNKYATNGIVYAIFDFSKQSDSEDFMYVLLRPLSESDPDPDDQTYEEHNSPLFNMSNEPEMYAVSIIDSLIGLDTAKKILTFGEEPVKVPVKKPQFVDPNQLSLFESLRKRVIKENVNLAPNGKQSNLTPEQYKLVRTPEFKSWFGDWENDSKNASKVVDDNGEPLVCYHETSLENASNLMKQGVFQNGKEKAAKFDYGTPYGFFFKSHDRKIGVGDTHLTTFLNIRNPLYARDRDSVDSIVSMLNLDFRELRHRIDSVDRNYNDMFEKAFDLVKTVGRKNDQDLINSEENIQLILDKWKNEINDLSIKCKKLLDKVIKDEGYDGVMIRNDEGSFGRNTDTKIVFKSNQIKLINNLTFNPDSDDIRSENIELYESLKKKIK